MIEFGPCVLQDVFDWSKSSVCPGKFLSYNYTLTSNFELTFITISIPLAIGTFLFNMHLLLHDFVQTL